MSNSPRIAFKVGTVSLLTRQEEHMVSCSYGQEDDGFVIDCLPALADPETTSRTPRSVGAPCRAVMASLACRGEERFTIAWLVGLEVGTSLQLCISPNLENISYSDCSLMLGGKPLTSRCDSEPSKECLILLGKDRTSIGFMKLNTESEDKATTRIGSFYLLKYCHKANEYFGCDEKSHRNPQVDPQKICLVT